MTNQEKKILIQRYFQGQCSATEKEQVQMFLKQADQDPEISQLLDQTWQTLELYPELDTATSEYIYQALSSKILLKKNIATSKVKPIQRVNTMWRIAAAVALLITFSGIGYRMFLHVQDQLWKTSYGQTAKITLPDNSIVMLNGNSSLRYKKGWNTTDTREVWLEGEAFFNVVHQANHQKFVVHTADQVDVEVLGTSFTVAKRKLGTRVVLNTGKVQLNVRKTNVPASVSLLPGDLVNITQNAAEIEKQRVNPEAYSSWTKQVLSFNNTPLREVIALLEETYGLEISVLDKELYSRKVSGSTPITKNLDLFFVGLEQTFDLEITRIGNKVRVKKRL